jgi:hypothetical protein
MASVKAIGTLVDSETQLTIHYDGLYNRVIPIAELFMVLFGIFLVTVDGSKLFDASSLSPQFNVVFGRLFGVVAIVLGLFLIQGAQLEKIVVDKTNRELVMEWHRWFGIRTITSRYPSSEIVGLVVVGETAQSGDGIYLERFNYNVFLKLRSNESLLLGLTNDAKKSAIVSALQTALELDDTQVVTEA